MLWDGGAHAVVPGLSRAGRAVESGGAGPSPGARPSPESGIVPTLDGLAASTPPGRPRGPGAGRRPPEPGDGTAVSAVGGVWNILAGLDTGCAGPGRGRPGADASGYSGRLGHGADAGAGGLSGPARPGRRGRPP